VSTPIANRTSIADLEATLPWGFHDAYLEGLEVDYATAVLVLRVRVMLSERQDVDRRAVLRVHGLVFCSIDPPELGEHTSELSPDRGLWIGSGAGAAGDARALPAVPEGCFLHWFYVEPWNRFIHVCGRRAELDWTEEAPMPARGRRRAHFPGDEA
jgi:hypothetical protein